MRVAFLTTNDRGHCRDYKKPDPDFRTAPEALLQGLAALPEIQAHVVSCTQKPMRSPAKLVDNIWFHSLHVPKIEWLRAAYQGCIRATRRKLHELKPDIVHDQGMERDCSISGVFSGFPNVLTIHGNIRLIARPEQAKPFWWLAARLDLFKLQIH